MAIWLVIKLTARPLEPGTLPERVMRDIFHPGSERGNDTLLTAHNGDTDRRAVKRKLFSRPMSNQAFRGNVSPIGKPHRSTSTCPITISFKKHKTTVSRPFGIFSGDSTLDIAYVRPGCCLRCLCHNDLYSAGSLTQPTSHDAHRAIFPLVPWGPEARWIRSH